MDPANTNGSKWSPIRNLKKKNTAFDSILWTELNTYKAVLVQLIFFNELE